MVPVYRATPDGIMRPVLSLADYSQEWYFVDANLSKQAFHNKVWLADFSPRRP